MSSIAYVTNEKMLEYHRLCRHQSILFWRLTTRNKFSDFRQGDLLFFFARGTQSRKKKGLVGYGHYVSTKKLSLQQMWKQYGNLTGYDTKEQLEAAISKAAKGEIPKQMLCLYLEDVVFFTSPVYPKDVDIQIPMNLESYCYIDRDDPQVTVKILQKANKYGIDIWSYSSNQSPEEIFEQDEIRHYLALAHHDMGKETGTSREKIASHKLVKQQVKENGWEMIRNSTTDCIKLSNKKVEIAVPFTYGTTDKESRLRDCIGRMMLYKIALRHMNKNVKFKVLMENTDSEMEYIVKELNDEV